MEIGKYKHRPGSVFRPSRSLLPRKKLSHALRLSLITAPVALLEVQHTESLEMFLKSLANERGPIHLLPLCCNIGRL